MKLPDQQHLVGRTSVPLPRRPRIAPSSVEEDGYHVTIPTPAGTRDGAAIDVVFVLDDSSSTHSTDPRNHRYVAAERHVNFIAEQASERAKPPVRRRRRRRPRHTGYDDRVGVLHYASSPGPVLPLTSVHEHRDVVMSSLTPGTSGGTDMPAAVAAAASMVQNSSNPLVIVWTDGDTGADTELVSALSLHRPDTVHLIAFAEGGLPPESLNHLSTLPFASVNDVDSMGTAGLEWAYSKPIVEAMGYTWRGAARPGHPSTTLNHRGSR